MGAGAFDKNIVRSISGSLGRFLAIAGIVALGCGFYAGLRMTAPDMDLSADAYYDETQLMDVRVVSTMGLVRADLDALRAVEGVEEVEGAFECDVLADIGDEQYAVRMHSLPYVTATLPVDEAGSVQEAFPVVQTEQQAVEVLARPNSLNRLQLHEGRWPTASGECIISSDRVMSSPTELGDTVRVVEGAQDVDDTLRVREYTIVGYASSPLYAGSTAMGATSLGSGSIEQFMYVPANDFAADLPFSEAYLLVAGAQAERAGSDAYQQAVDAVVERVNGIAAACEQRRLADIKAEAQAELDEARATYEAERADAEGELADARAKLDDAQAQIASSEQQLASGQRDYDQGAAKLTRERASAAQKLADAQKQIDSQATQLASNKQQLTAQAQQLQAQRQQLVEQQRQLKTQQQAAQTQATQLQQQVAQLEQAAAADPGNAVLQQQLVAARAGLAQAQAGLKQLSDGLSQVEEGIAQVDAGSAKVDAGLARVAQGEQQLAVGRTELAQQRTQADAQLSAASAELSNAAAQLASGRDQLASGRAEYETGLADYEAGRAEADSSFADAEAELARAQADIDAIEMPEWLVMDRTKNPGAVSFSSDADRVDNIAAFFPFIFFLVAALVALTTMTRMVEEERTLIGTFKALGYSRARITSKYLTYAAAASATGAAFGIIVLSLVLPPVIMEAYAIIYSVPHGAIMPIDVPIALTSGAMGVGITLLATWAAAASTLREAPANLMRPRAPKEGKRILMERIGPLWRRLSFSWKVTFRNIFRYKKRLVMTVIGIAGCTGLLLTGLALQDSINDIIDKQFGVTKLYNVEVTADDALSPEAREQLSDLASASAFEQSEALLASGPDKADVQVSLVVPEDPASYDSMWVFRTREGHVPVALEGDGAVITEKLGRVLGVGVGDMLTLAEHDLMGNATSDVPTGTVSGIIENYIANYVFLTPQGYERAFGSAPVYSTMVGIVDGGSEAHAAFREAAAAVPSVKTVAFNDETIDSYRTMLRSVNMIVVVLVVAAAVLAFIVLYNLTNINITERQREIATLKVLGFTSREVDLYIYRETILLTLLGALVGLGFGVVLAGSVISTAEVDYVMFGRDIHVTSYVMAVVVTIVFAVIVMLAMRPKLAKVNMVESLKSNE